MYSFLRKPIWVLSHILVALLVVVMIFLGFWQRSRYFEERDEKQKLETLATADPVPLREFISSADIDSTDVNASVRYKRVQVSGTYDLDREVIISNRSLDGAPGAWILTPLIQRDGTAVPVVRGWIPFAMAEKGTPVTSAKPPDGRVTVLGNLQPTQERQSFGPVDSSTGTLDELSRVDLARLQKQVPYDLEPVWVLLDSQRPPQSGDLPALVSLQSGDPSTNFSYMMQWWIFSLIAGGGYPLVLRAVAKGRSRESRDGTGRRRRGGPDEIPWAEGLGPDRDQPVSSRT